MTEGRDPVEGPAAIALGSPPGTPRRRSWRIAAVAGAALVVALALAGSAVLWSGTPSTSPGPTAGATASSTAGPAPSGTTGPSGADVAWGPLTLPPLEPIAELTADVVDAAGPDPATTFTLRSLDGSPVAPLAAGLSVHPGIAISTEPGPDPSRVIVRPGQPLTRGAAYRFTLAAPDGTFAGGWAFQVAAPPRIVSTIPADGTSRVPTTTGIEIAFDTDGVVDPSPWVAVQPPVTGDFERHGRTWVLVPERLEPATLYTVTIRAGIPITGSALATEHVTRIQFETAAVAGSLPDLGVSVAFGRPVIESAPGTRPVLGVYVNTTGSTRPPKTLTVDLRRLAGVDAAVAAARALIDRPTWIEHPTDAVDPMSLPAVARVATRLTLDGENGYVGSIELPFVLDAGWYLVDLPDDVARGQQALLQVTPLAPYVAAARDRTVTWVNAVGRGAVAGATVAVVGGAELGRTGADGLLVAATPPGLLPDRDAPDPWAVARPILVVTAADLGAVVVPLGSDSAAGYTQETWNPYAWSDERSAAWWHSLAVDRSVVRASDTIAAWGVARERATGTVPAAVDLVLRAQAMGDGPDVAAPVAAARAVPSATGTYSAALAFVDVPMGEYTLEMSVDGTVLDSAWIEVGVIRKPDYRIAVSTDRYAYMSGDRIVTTATATFYDSTPVPGLPLAFDASDLEGSAKAAHEATTGADGSATVTFTPLSDEEGGSGSVTVTPARPELGDASGSSAWVIVYPAAVDVRTMTASIGDGVVHVSGTVERPDLAALDRSHSTDGDWPPERIGPPVAGVHVTLTMTGTRWVAIRAGATYDFIAKQSVPAYRYEQREIARVVAPATSRADGTFATALALPAGAREAGVDLRVRAIVTDTVGRSSATMAFATRPIAMGTSREVWVDRVDGEFVGAPCGAPTDAYVPGDRLSLALKDRDGRLPDGGTNTYLFIVARAGIRETIVSTSSTLARRFETADMPSIDVSAVAFDGATYRASSSAFRATTAMEQRRVAVTVSSDRASYRPGTTARVTVRTKDASGLPAPADVVVIAVDEKLYDMGVAWTEDPAWSLYAPIDGGLVGTYASHQVPLQANAPGCGSTTGGGGGGGGDTLRDDFRDRVLFRQVATGADGTAEIDVSLPDDLTAWRVTATAVTDDLGTGIGMADLPVGLPFFVVPVAPDVVMVDDSPSVVLRAYGSALRSGDIVRFTVRAPTLAAAPATAEVPAFGTGVVRLTTGSPLPVGLHRITVEAAVSTADGEMRDALVRDIRVVASNVVAHQSVTVPLAPSIALPGAIDGLTTCTIADAGRGRLVPLLESIAASTGPRADQGAAAAAARETLVREFARDPATFPDVTFDPMPFMAGPGVALVPYSAADPELTARIAIGAAGAFPRGTLVTLLDDTLAEPLSTREQRIVALAGLASLGEPVIDEIRVAAAVTDLTPLERVWLAVAAGEAGDVATAVRLERGLLAASGEAAGSWARLRIGTTLHDSIDASALLAVAAADIGDSVAADLVAYVTSQADTEGLNLLEEVAYVTRVLARTAAVGARFAYTIEGDRRVVDLGRGEATTLVLTPAQRATAVVEPIAGDPAITCAWDAPVGAGGLPHDPDVWIGRRALPAGPIGPDDLVTVEIRVRIDGQAPQGLYRVVDVLPAGLAPTGARISPVVEGEAAPDAVLPWSISGNRVEWGLWAGGTQGSYLLRVYARVVAPGTYSWEPAVAELVQAPSVGAATAATTVTVLAP